MNKPKVAHIESLRGIAILLVVMGHVIGSTPGGGMKIDLPSYWRYIYLWIDYIQMPLFTAISGWVYALAPIKVNLSIGKFMQKKVYRLLLPMIIAATAYFLIQYIIPGTNQKGNLAEIWRIYVFPYTIYWYLPSLFIMFFMIVIIDKLKWAANIQGWIICSIAVYLGLIAVKGSLIPDSIPNLFSFKGTLSQFPYFIIGLGVNRFSKELFTSKLKKYYMLFAFIGIVLLQFKWFYPIAKDPICQLTQPLWVIALLIVVLHQTRYSNRFFVWLGGYAYIIYLYHGFGTSGGRIILSRLGIHSELLIFLFATIIAVCLPILIETLVKKWKVLRFLILGIK